MSTSYHTGRQGRKGKQDIRAKRTAGASRLLREALAHTKPQGLYVLEERRPGRGGPRWTVYDRRTGLELLTYFPHSGIWRAGDRDGRCAGWAEALDLAARRRRR